MDEPPELVELQTDHWDPVIQWFNDRYSADIKPTTAIISPTIAEETLENLKGHLRSHNEWSLVGNDFYRLEMSSAMQIKFVIVAYQAPYSL